jgi:putative transposase
MPNKPRNFNPDFYYHVYNRGVEKRKIFLNDRDYRRFLASANFYLKDQLISFAEFERITPEAKTLYLQTNLKGLGVKGLDGHKVKILAYCLMPNHFHFLIKSAREGGISKFISDVSNSHAKYFNLKNKRVGGLFQGTFKAREISSEPSLLQVSRYIHLQTNLKGLGGKPEEYPYSSYAEWLGIRKPYLVNEDELRYWLRSANGPQKYREFVEAKAAGNPALGIADLILEEEEE